MRKNLNLLIIAYGLPLEVEDLGGYKATVLGYSKRHKNAVIIRWEHPIGVSRFFYNNAKDTGWSIPR